jgi:hypothetical protein
MTKRDRIVIGVVACMVAVAGFWFLALKPKRADLSAATAKVADAQTRLTDANQVLASATKARASFDTDYATIARLGKAVPDDDDAASLVYQLEAAARKAGIDFRSLTVGGGTAAATPATPAPAPAPATGSGSSSSTGSSSSSPAPTGTSSSTPSTGAAATPATGTSALPPGVVAGANGMNELPFTFVFDGDYFSLNKLLDLIRSFTTTNGDTVTVRGRLMTVESVNLQESRNGFPQVKATVNATAYLSATPVTLPGGGTSLTPSNGTTPATKTAPSTQAAGTKTSLPTATVTPGAIK